MKRMRRKGPSVAERQMQLLAARSLDTGAVIADAVAGIGAVLAERLDGEAGQ